MNYKFEALNNAIIAATIKIKRLDEIENFQETSMPLNKEELEKYLELLRQVENYPKSIRVFNEVHEATLRIAFERGERKFFSRILSFMQDTRKEAREEERDISGDSLSIVYAQGFMQDVMQITLCEDALLRSIYLVRRMGCQSLKKIAYRGLDSTIIDIIDVIASGKGKIETYLGFQPFLIGKETSTSTEGDLEVTVMGS